MRINNPIYRRKEDRLIYAFVSPVDKICYVNHCRKEALRETYRHHTNGERYCTERFMKAVHPHRPCVFVLEELTNISIAKAYRYVLVWTRLLLENGYQSYNYQTTVDQANDLLFETERLYLQRKETSLQAVLSCEKCPVKVYKKCECEFCNVNTRKE